MNLTLDIGYWVVIFLSSVIGFAFFRYGRKQQEIWFVGAGIALMAVGYFFSTTTWLI